MADLNKVRVQVLDPATGRVVENVDVKTSDAAVYLPDGTSLRDWISNSDLEYSDIQKTLAEHLASKHVDEDKVDTLLTGITYDRATGKFSITNHKGETSEIDTLLEKLPVKFELVDGNGIDGFTEGDKVLQITLDDGTKQYAKLSDLIDIYTGGTNAEVAVAVSDTNEITATLVDGGITAAKIADGTITRAKIDTAFEQQIAKIEEQVGDSSVPEQITAEINKLDATVTNKTGETTPDVTVTVTQEDGKLTAVTAEVKPETFDAFGAAKAVQGETTETVKSVDDKVVALTESSKVAVEKLATPTTGFIASYVVKQNGTQVGATIDIPKDYLVKSAELKTAAADIKSGDNVVVASGHKYIDFVVNTADAAGGNESHIYLDVNTLVDVYKGVTGTEIAVAVDAQNNISASLVDGGISYAKLDANLKSKIDEVFTLEAATADELGGVKIGNGIAVTEDGTISTENLKKDGVATSMNFVSDAATVVLTVTGPEKSLVSTKVGTAVAAQTITAIKTGDKADAATLAYKWYKKAVGTDTAFVEIAGATTATLDAAKIDVAKAGTTMYYCVVSATGEGVVADAAASKKVTVVVA